MNISRAATNRTPFRTTRSKSSCAQMTDSVRQSSFGEVLKEAAPAKDTFRSTSAAERTPVKFSSIPETRAKLEIISEAIKNTDYSEMSNAEIYADIEGKYTNAFDDYFASRAVFPCKDYEEINNSFIFTVRENIEPKSITTALVNEARGYSGMSYDEIEAAIKEKYADKTGFIDQLNLLGELFTSGVLSNKLGHDETFFMLCRLDTSIECRECGHNEEVSKSEWLSKIEEAGVSSPFSLLLNNPYYAEFKEMYQSMVDEILFGIADKI